MATNGLLKNHQNQLHKDQCYFKLNSFKRTEENSNVQSSSYSNYNEKTLECTQCMAGTLLIYQAMQRKYASIWAYLIERKGISNRN